MNKRKIYLGILTITNIVWIFVLLRIEFFLLQLNSKLGEYSMFIGNVKIPFLLHLVIILTIVSLIVWLWYHFGELTGLYSTELNKTKEKIHQITAEKPQEEEVKEADKIETDEVKNDK